MTDDMMLQQLTEVFRSVFAMPGMVLRPEMSAADIPEWDSLNNVKLLLACERAFGVRLKARDINGLENIGGFIAHLKARLAK
jgi:acyl carrier protein